MSHFYFNPYVFLYLSCVTQDIVNKGFHSIAYIQVRELKKKGMDIHCNRGKNKYDKPYLEQIDAIEWAGPVRWHDGWYDA